jgi:glucuronate isomerase
MDHNFLLKNEVAIKLYETCARDLPIIDYHNHLNVADILSDRKFENITRLWISVDPYKHRAMRILGVPERYITGDATDYEKFEKWYHCIPRLVGNALYDWSVMEFDLIFGITLPPFRADPREVWDEVNEKLKTLSARGILSKFNLEYSAPCASLNDDLSVFEGLEGISPSLRGDNILGPDAELVRQLGKLTGITVADLQSFAQALDLRLTAFKAAGCKFSDHALDDGFRYLADDGQNEARFSASMRGEKLGEEDREKLSSHILKMLGALYAKHGLTMQLHIGAKRTTSSRLRQIAGPAGGYAAIGRCVDVKSLTDLLDAVEQQPYGLPKTILFTLNPADNAVMSVLSGSYSKDGVEAIVSQGPAWWWCDHYQGMREMLDHLCVYGVMSTFIGMTTDSRSLLSFVRHDYFRRILCQWIGNQVQQGILPDDFAILSDTVRRMCYQNAKNCIEQ